MKYLILFVLLVPVTFLQAQTKIKLPAFGQVSNTELQMKECSFEVSAGAMVLFDEAESYLGINFENNQIPVIQQTKHHTRIKIFNKKEFDKANIKIKYRNDPSVSVKKLNAQTYTIDANENVVITKVEKSSIYTKQIDKRFGETTFAFSNVKEGSIIEYEYVVVGETESNWFFQKSIPVEYSRFIVNFPKEVSITATPYCSLPLQQSNNSQNNSSDTWYSMEKIPSFVNEPFMTTPLDYMQRLDLHIIGFSAPGQLYKNLLRTWPQIVKELLEDDDFGQQLKKDIPRTADLDKLLENSSNDMQKMQIIHQYVRSNMKWNGRENIWALDGVKKAWKDKVGTSGEINLILINLLKDAKLNVKPILVSTRENGIINTTMASYDQFDKVMAYVEINGTHYVLDATETETPSHLIPLSVMSSEGLGISKPDKFEWGWKVLWDEKAKYSKAAYLNMSLTESGDITGTANVVSSGYEKIDDLKILKNGKDKLLENLRNDPKITIDSLMLTNVDIDTLPLVEEFNFNLPANKSGGYNYFSINHFIGFKKNPFISDERNTDIFYGAKQEYSLSAQINIPKDYFFEELPKSLKMIMPDTSMVFKRIVSHGENNITVSINIQINNPFYGINVYEDVQQFFRKMYELLNEKFVFKKNKA